MRAAERKLVTAIRDAANNYLDASNYAERYFYGSQFANALIAYNEHALATLEPASGPVRETQ